MKMTTSNNVLTIHLNRDDIVQLLHRRSHFLGLNPDPLPTPKNYADRLVKLIIHQVRQDIANLQDTPSYLYWMDVIDLIPPTYSKTTYFKT